MALRRATANDVPDVNEIVQGAFGHDYSEWLVDDWPNWLLYEVDGRPTGTLRLTSEELTYGPGRFTKAEIGHVAIAPERQGQGHGSAMMRALVIRIREEGFALSRLGGSQPFYSRFGYVPFPRRYWRFPSGSSRAGARTISLEEKLSAGDDQASLRPYHPAVDWRAVGELTAAVHTGLVAAPAPTEPRPAMGEPNPDGLDWVYDDGQVRARASAWTRGTRASISAVADLAHPLALPALLRGLMLRLHHQGITEFVGRLPFDPAVERCLAEGGLGFHLEEHHTAPAGNLLLLADLRALLAAMLPGWTADLAASPGGWQGLLEVRAGEQRQCIELTADGCGLVTGGRPDAVLAAPERQALLLLLAHRSLDEVRPMLTEQLPAAAEDRLRRLLIRRPTATGPLG